jgi:hypothetical protein
MTNTRKGVALTQKIYEFIKARGCVTTDEVASSLGIAKRLAYLLIRALVTKRLVLPYRPSIGRGRIYCIPHVGDRLYGQYARLNVTGLICITLPIDTIELLDTVATSMGETRSSIIRQALLRYLGSHNQHVQQEELPEDEKLAFIVPDR